MRTFTRLFSLLAAFLLPFTLFANVYVHGTVKRTNGTLVSDYEVRIETDSLNSTPSVCQVVHFKRTNPNGFYSDTLVCSAAITRIFVLVRDCNGSTIRHEHNVPASQNVESNFIICDSAHPCQTNFGWQIEGLSVHFFSGGSSGTSNTDTITSRLWTFGDGTSLSGNVVNPDHQYNIAGVYTVCLKTRAVSGCEKIICNTVLVSNNVCTANFIWEQIANTNRIRFHSTSSTAIASDSIISHKWKFGDGDSLNGNVISPEHTYAHAGTYNACLTIKTAVGCEKTICKLVEIQTPANSCHASFYAQFPGANIVGQPIIFNSSPSTVSPGDSILQRTWNFGDGTTSNSTIQTHIYTQPGFYTVCLAIRSASGCHDTLCQGNLIIAVPLLHCEAVYTIENITTPPAGSNPALHYVRFNSSNSHGSTLSDSIISHTWSFGDGTPNLQGNQVNPLHGYTQSGSYNTCLYILTQSGCRDTVCHTVVVAAAPVTCMPRFTTNATGLSVVFNSSTTTIAAGDSIINRTWTFGDGTTTNNPVVLTHQYAHVGEYQVCLTIRTRQGCISTWCKKLPVIDQPGNCVPYFTKEQVSTPARTMRFNSIAAYSQLPNDSVIIERRWEFGDGQTLNGNVINPLHTYLHGGTYNVCLFIRTSHCDGHWCQPVLVRPTDSTNITDSIQIVNLYPVPVTTQLNTVIYSSHNNVNAELAIYDVYGVKKWSQNKLLPQGNSTHNIPTSQLTNGPYIFRVTTIYGIKSRNFYKLN